MGNWGGFSISQFSPILPSPPLHGDGGRKLTEARQILAEIYNWFTEGFDTADLKDAKALLEGVSRTLDGKLSDALGKMRAGPSEPPFRRRLQTAPGCGV